MFQNSSTFPGHQNAAAGQSPRFHLIPCLNETLHQFLTGSFQQIGTQTKQRPSIGCSQKPFGFIQTVCSQPQINQP